MTTAASIIGQDYHESIEIDPETLHDSVRELFILRNARFLMQRALNTIQNAAQHGEIVGAHVKSLMIADGKLTLRIAFTKPEDWPVK